MSDTSSTSVTSSPSRSYYIFLVIYMVLLSAFGSFVNDMYLPCLPDMVKVFGCSIPQIQLSLTMGMIGLGAGEIIFGTISDKYGRKPVLVTALIMFFVSALASIFSRSLSFFLACRLIQGLGGSAGYFLARTIPADIFGGRKLAHFMGIIGAINGLAPAVAPVAGGFLADSVGWKGIFVVLTAFSVLLLILCFHLKESLPPSRRFAGSLLDTFGNYRSLLTNRRFMIHVMLKDTALGLLFAYIASSPFIIQTHFGYTPTQYGLFIGLNAIVMGTGSFLASRFKVLKRAGFLGSLLLMATVILESVVMLVVDNFWLYEGLLLPVMFSMGMIFTVGNTLAMNEGRADAGSASGLLGIFGYIIGAAVSPIVGMGNILHTTAFVFLVISALVLICGYATSRLPADLNSDPSGE